MCKVLGIAKSSYYYKAKEKTPQLALDEKITTIFNNSRKNYGSRKIKVELKKAGIIASRRKIRKIMNKFCLVSNYTKMQFKVHKTNCNQDTTQNQLNRNFSRQKPYAVIVSDLTYVRVKDKWHYICIIVDLFNREIVGYSTGKNKDSQLVIVALAKIQTDLRNIKIFHTDRGSEFKSHAVEKILKEMGIGRSLAQKGCPYDNAVAEATFKICKTEFIKVSTFNDLSQLNLELADYINWFNNVRIHGALNYQTPAEVRRQTLKSLS